MSCLLSDLQKLATASRRRQRTAFRPGTIRNHQSQFRCYMTFCSYFGLKYLDPEVSTLCMYCEFLARTFKSPKTIRNYISGVRLLHKFAHIESTAVHSFEVDLMLRSLSINMRHVPNQRQVISPAMLRTLCSLTLCLGALGSVLKCAILFAYFGFLRQSNLAPPSAKLFDHTRHTCRSDILFHPPGIIIIMKWSKTLQSAASCHLVPIPGIPGHTLCPVQAFQDMVAIIPSAGPNTPLLMLPGRTGALGLDKLSRAFKVLLSTAGCDTTKYSLHSLRRSGATAAYTAGVDFTHIKRHGTWRSDAFWEYISTESASTSPVATALAKTMQDNI